jgi:hypothetical protein
MGDKKKLMNTAIEVIDLFPRSSTPYVYLADSLREGKMCPNYLDLLDLIDIGGRGDLHTLSIGVVEQMQQELLVCGLLK